MERFCFFCVKNCSENLNYLRSLGNGEVGNENKLGIHPSEKELFKKFFKFIKRYLKDTKESKGDFGSEFDCCGNCAKTVSLICDLYHDLKTVELLINWQLWALNKVMTDADKATSKLQNYEEYLKKAENLNGNNTNTPLKELLEVRKDFVENCKGKLLGSYPQLVLNKYLPENQEENNQNQPSESHSPSPCLSAALSCVSDEYDCSVPETCLPEGAFDEEPLPLQDIKLLLESKICVISPPSKPAALELKNSLDRIAKPTSRKRRESNKAKLNQLKLQKKTVQKYEDMSPEDSYCPANDSEPILLLKKDINFETNEVTIFQEIPKENEDVAPGNLGDERDSDYEMSDDESQSDTDYSSEEDEELKPRKKKKTTGSNNVKLKRIRSSGGPIECTYCHRTFTRKDQLRRHILRKHKEKLASAVQDPNICSYSRRYYRYICPDENCEKIFKQIHLLLQHWRDSHSQKEPEGSNPAPGGNLIVEIVTFGVDPDAQVFKTLDAEVTQPKHYTKIDLPQLKPDVKQSICEIDSCKRIFYSEEDLQTHRKLHGSFACASCPVAKTFLPELSMHELKTHGGKQGSGRKVVKCPRCDETFAELSVYIRHHISVHFSLKFEEQTCPICKTYLPHYEITDHSNASYFYDHLKNSHGLGDPIGDVFRCPEEGCSAYFLARLGMTFHLKVDHQLEKEKLNKFVKQRDLRFCEVCGKGFKEANFDLHILSHTGPQSWTFACEVCGKKCMTEQNLNVHKRVHTQEKPFVCQVCGVKYAHRYNLRIHIKNKHGDLVQDVARKCKRSTPSARKGKQMNRTNYNSKTGN